MAFAAGEYLRATGANTCESRSIAEVWSDLGVEPGADVQAYNEHIATIAGLAKNNGNFIVGNGTTWGVKSLAQARASLGLTIGTHVQAYNAGLTDISGLSKAAGNFIVGDGSNWGVESGATARASLGLVIGTHVQAYSDSLADISGLAKTDGNFIVGNGSNWVVESGATARASLGLAIGADVQAYSDYLADIVAISPSQGDLIYYDGADWVALGAGTDGQVLQTNGAGANPSWGTVGLTGGGLGTDVSAYDGFVKISGGTVSEVPVTSAGQALLDDTSAYYQRTTLGLKIGDDVQAYSYLLQEAADAGQQDAITPLNAGDYDFSASYVEAEHEAFSAAVAEKINAINTALLALGLFRS